MAPKFRWETRRVECPEEGRTAELLIEWREENGQAVVHSVTCDNPKLAGLDNWDCCWSCWKKLDQDEA